MCNPHHLRWLRHGDPLARPKGGPGSAHWSPRESLTYDAAHDRVKRYRGAPSAHTCECGRPAEDWSYDHTDPDPLYDQRGLPFSDDLNRYVPRCRSCHKRFDWAVKQKTEIRNILTTDEAATLLGIAPATVRRWVMKGWLTPIRRATNPLMFRYLDVENARIARLPAQWHDHLDDLAARWERACLESTSG